MCSQLNSELQMNANDSRDIQRWPPNDSRIRPVITRNHNLQSLVLFFVSFAGSGCASVRTLGMVQQFLGAQFFFTFFGITDKQSMHCTFTIKFRNDFDALVFELWTAFPLHDTHRHMI